jgi:hypothetical protein
MSIAGTLANTHASTLALLGMGSAPALLLPLPPLLLLLRLLSLLSLGVSDSTVDGARELDAERLLRQRSSADSLPRRSAVGGDLLVGLLFDLLFEEETECSGEEARPEPDVDVDADADTDVAPPNRRRCA